MDAVRTSTTSFRRCSDLEITTNAHGVCVRRSTGAPHRELNSVAAMANFTEPSPHASKFFPPAAPEVDAHMDRRPGALLGVMHTQWG
jgi:hypothetical protein